MLVLLIIILIIIITYFVIKKKIRDFSQEFFGTTDIKKAIKDLEYEAETTPKSLAGMEPVIKTRMKKDFPHLNLNELKSIAENKIIGCFKDIEEKNLDKIYESEKIANFIRERVEKNATYDSIKIHKTVINSYENRNNMATIKVRTSLEYIYSDSRKQQKKVQTRFETEFINIIDSSKLPEKQKGLSLNCPNCGAPIKNLQEKYCVYCNCGIIDIVKKVWTFNNIREF